MTLVKGDPKAPFSIATTPRWRESVTPFPGLLHFILDLYLIMLSVKQGHTKYHFWVFGMNQPGIEPWYSGPLGNSLKKEQNKQVNFRLFIQSKGKRPLKFLRLFTFFWT